MWTTSGICIDRNNVSNAQIFSEYQPFSWPIGQWRHFAKTWDSTTGEVKLYVDGVLTLDVTTTPWDPLAASHFRFGQTSWTGTSSSIVFVSFTERNLYIVKPQYSHELCPYTDQRRWVQRNVCNVPR